MKRLLIAVCLGTLLLPGTLRAADAGLQPGDFVAIVGDSITEQKLYPMYIEEYLTMCQPVANIRVTQFGWSGETAFGFANRMANDMLRFHPMVVTTCFGMNDGGYSPMNPGKAQWYADNQRRIVDMCKKQGVRWMVVGSPGCVDSESYHKNPVQAAEYNKTLAAERDIARELAQSTDETFANVYDPMIDVMAKMKAKYGKNYNLAGGDGVHPDRSGHLVMAYAFLKALGCSGDIGKIAVHLADGKAEGSPGHKIVSAAGGTVEVESSRYPFCFYGEPSQANATRGVIEFLPFNQDLNRFILTVDGLSADNAKVTWGPTTRVFSKDQLAGGINLAAEFVNNPFSEPFQKLEGPIWNKQQYEISLVKDFITKVPQFKQMVPDGANQLEEVIDNGIRRDRVLSDQVAALVKPVRHQIVIEPLPGPSK